MDTFNIFNEIFVSKNAILRIFFKINFAILRIFFKINFAISEKSCIFAAIFKIEYHDFQA